MEKIKSFLKKIKNNNLWMDFFNLSAGIVLIIVVILFCLFPGSKLIIGAMFLLTGFMNLSNGVEKYKIKKSRGTGMVLITISMVTLFAGLVFLSFMG